MKGHGLVKIYMPDRSGGPNKSFLEGPLKGYYVNPQAEVIVDFEQNNRATFQLAANAGKVLSKNVVVFVVPTIHVAGTKREGFKLEVGFRYLFR